MRSFSRWWLRLRSWRWVGMKECVSKISDGDQQLCTFLWLCVIMILGLVSRIQTGQVSECSWKPRECECWQWSIHCNINISLQKRFKKHKRGEKWATDWCSVRKRKRKRKETEKDAGWKWSHLGKCAHGLSRKLVLAVPWYRDSPSNHVLWMHLPVGCH